ncbi:NUDIX domain-containing protein [Roseisalinus antarcticus]|uniref:Nudix hydrolase domain-containing protein n=1 Tax=Roseisalinus antarcticus TaxID=254357 RepID=A0A1Y5SMM1_9RHOB|nr:NUDIX hydrolase [Roseisalinus antarcticus]SLN44086.1 hypothetical protein ROA7023_01805 [Roseisalinus antarcticus]
MENFIGSKVALFLGARLLVCLRDDFAHIPFPGEWDFPGGAREAGESPWQTLVREVDEEFGLEMDRAEVLWQSVGPSALDPDRLIWFYVARMDEAAVGDVLFGDEGQAWALMAPDAVLALDKLVAHHRPRLECYRALSGGWGLPVPRDHWS